MKVLCRPCRRFHEEPACARRRPGVAMTVHLPAHVADRLHRCVPWGERSGWIARAIERTLDQEQHA